jgi:hypothetical protein
MLARVHRRRGGRRICGKVFPNVTFWVSLKPQRNPAGCCLALVIGGFVDRDGARSESCFAIGTSGISRSIAPQRTVPTVGTTVLTGRGPLCRIARAVARLPEPSRYARWVARVDQLEFRLMEFERPELCGSCHVQWFDVVDAQRFWRGSAWGHTLSQAVDTAEDWLAGRQDGFGVTGLDPA